MIFSKVFNYPGTHLVGALVAPRCGGLERVAAGDAEVPPHGHPGGGLPVALHRVAAVGGTE